MADKTYVTKMGTTKRSAGPISNEAVAKLRVTFGTTHKAAERPQTLLEAFQHAARKADTRTNVSGTTPPLEPGIMGQILNEMRTQREAFDKSPRATRNDAPTPAKRGSDLAPSGPYDNGLLDQILRVMRDQRKP